MFPPIKSLNRAVAILEQADFVLQGQTIVATMKHAMDIGRILRTQDEFTFQTR